MENYVDKHTQRRGMSCEKEGCNPDPIVFAIKNVKAKQIGKKIVKEKKNNSNGDQENITKTNIVHIYGVAEL